MEYNYKNLFASRREEFIAILGQDFFATVLADDDFTSSALVLSDKRVYQVGNVYEPRLRLLNGGLRAGRGRKIVNLADITGTTTIEYRKTIAGYVIMFFGALAIALGLMSDVRQSTVIMLFAGTPIVLLGLFLSLRRSRKYLVIEFPDGKLIQPIKFATESEVSLFQGLITIEKDKILDGYNDSKECPNCAEKIHYKAKTCKYCGHDQEENPAV
ncbi:MAG: zinc ribbon domain-containing protein [Bacteroidales bacterium]|jgi:hypothetical protein|nr:zinc ribbon domain-containing protein [Bacteroidales bacterium]